MTIDLNNAPAVQEILHDAERKIKALFGNALKLKVIEDKTQVKNLNGFIEQCALLWNVEEAYFCDKRRTGDRVAMRAVICHFTQSLFPSNSLKSIATRIGLKDHAGTIYGRKLAADMLVTSDPLFMSYYEPINNFINDAQ